MENCMEYKGYIGKISYSTEDEVFFGTIHGINDLITFEGDSVSELKKAFHESVDEYLEMCERLQKSPEKAYKGQFNVRIDPDLHKAIALKATLLNISINQYVEIALAKCISGEYDKLLSISDRLEKFTDEISVKLYKETSKLWDDNSNYFPIECVEQELKKRSVM